jgi:thiopeptide-type bacteriocin biosynthesis protein
MKICFICPYPPEPGGAGQEAYWAALGLAERGHQVLVITALTAGQRVCLDETDAPDYQPEYQDSGGFVRVMCAAAGAASLARLASEAAGGLAIVAAATEPYATAGQLAARWSGKPLLVWPDDADCPLPASMFHPDAPALGTADIVRLDAAPDPAGPGLESRGTEPRRRHFAAGLPSVGGYGDQAGRLLAALSSLQAEGLRCNVVLMCEPSARASLRFAAAAAGLADSLWLVPLLPPWRMPGFIRACTVVCALNPPAASIATQVLACGTCLVLSGRVRARLGYGDELDHGTSAVVVPDSGTPAALAGRLRPLIRQPSAAAGIAACGHLVARKSAGFAEFADGWEARILAIRPSSGAGPAGGQANPATELPDMLIENGIAAAERACRGTGWLQFGLTLPPAVSGQRAALYAALRDTASEALTTGLAAEFFYMHKLPGMRLRFQEAGSGELTAYLHERLSDWERRGMLTSWRPGVYEPEAHLFGGPVSMRSVHRVFTADSLAWLGYHGSQARGDRPGPVWAMSLLMVRALLDALRIAGWEDRDVWDRLRRQTGRRLGPAASANSTLARLSALLQPAWSSPAALAEPLSGPAREFAQAYRDAVLDEAGRWFTDYFGSGQAPAGPREIAAFMIVFHWNRAGFPVIRQALITEALLLRGEGEQR